jgi:AmpD protein
VKINLTTGLLDAADFFPSPHFNHRPEGMEIDMVVVHNISLPPAEFGTNCVQQFFCGTLDFTGHPFFEGIKELRVSAHLFLRRDGSLLQFVPFHERAWHAGVSTFDGRSGCNDFSIGIELEGTDDLPYEKIQYQRLAEVIAALQLAYPAIMRKQIVGHSDIAPGRKTDPGPSFEWAALDCLLMTSSA